MDDQNKIKASISDPDGGLNIDKLSFMLLEIQKEIKKMNERLTSLENK